MHQLFICVWLIICRRVPLFVHINVHTVSLMCHIVYWFCHMCVLVSYKYSQMFDTIFKDFHMCPCAFHWDAQMRSIRLHWLIIDCIFSSYVFGVFHKRFIACAFMSLFVHCFVIWFFYAIHMFAIYKYMCYCGATSKRFSNTSPFCQAEHLNIFMFEFSMSKHLPNTCQYVFKTSPIVFPTSIPRK